MTASRAGSRVLVLGAGVAGLAAAERLQAAGFEPLVLEQGAAPGGRAQSTAEQGFRIDWGPPLLSTRDAQLLHLVRLVAEHMLPLRPARFAQVQGGKIVPIRPTGLRGVQSLPGLRGRRFYQGLRLRRWPRLLRRYRPHLSCNAAAAGPLDDRSAADFINLYFGDGVLESWVEPWLASELGADVASASRALLLLHYRARAFAPAGALRGALGDFSSALAGRFAVHTRTSVVQVVQTAQGFRVETAPGVSGVSGTPDVANTPNMPGAAGAPSAPGTPNTPDVANMPGTPNTPGAARAPSAPNTPGVANMPGMPNTPDAARAPSAPNTPGAPDAAPQSIEADAVICALPAQAARACLAPTLAPAEQDLLDRFRCAPALAAAFALDAPLQSVFTRVRVPRREASPAAVISLEPGVAAPSASAPQGRGLATVIARPAWSRAHLHAAEGEILSALSGTLERCLPEARHGVRFARLKRFAYAFPCFDVGRYRELAALERSCAELRARGRRLYLAGDYLQAPTLSGAACSGVRAADACIEDLSS